MAYNDYRPIDKTFLASDPAYSAGDVVGALLTLTMYQPFGFIRGASVAIGEASIAVPGTIWLYSEQPSAILDNAAFAVTHADNKKILGKILLPTADALNSFNVYHAILATPIPYWTATIYAYFVTSGTPNFTGTDKEVGIRFYVSSER